MNELSVIKLISIILPKPSSQGCLSLSLASIPIFNEVVPWKSRNDTQAYTFQHLLSAESPCFQLFFLWKQPRLYNSHKLRIVLSLFKLVESNLLFFQMPFSQKSHQVQLQQLSFLNWQLISKTQQCQKRTDLHRFQQHRNLKFPLLKASTQSFLLLS